MRWASINAPKYLNELLLSVKFEEILIKRMKEEEWVIRFKSFTSIDDLAEDDRSLLLKARSALDQAYAPYSNFQVAAAVRLLSGETAVATNQENASYGLSLCAEQNVLSNVGSQYHSDPVQSMAITVKYLNRLVAYPISPCGACRQVIREHEVRHQEPMRIILQGQTGRVLVFSSIADLLPLAFTPDDLRSE